MKFDNFETWKVKREIEIFKSYLKEIKGFLDKKEIEGSGKWENLNEEERDLYVDSFIEHQDEIKKQNQIFYSSFIIAIFSFFEYELNRICVKYPADKKNKVVLKDIAGKGIKRARLYMQKVCQIVLPKEELWKELEKLNEIRNCLAHSSGEIKNNPSLVRYAKNNQKIKIESDKITKTKSIAITRGYCLFVIGIINEYLIILIKDNVKNGRWWRNKKPFLNN